MARADRRCDRFRLRKAWVRALGVAFAAFFLVLIFFAWSFGLRVSGILLRYWLGPENLVWSLMFIIQPLGCVSDNAALIASINGPNFGGCASISTLICGARRCTPG
jgi:uncharacterized membrane protein